jgi:rubrerythrin
MIAAAEAEGDKKAVRSMHFALEVEKVHYELYGMAIKAVAAGKDVGDAKVRVCPICGHTVIGDAPDSCPVCGCIGSRYLEIA